MAHVHPCSIAMWVFPEGMLDDEGVQQISTRFWGFARICESNNKGLMKRLRIVVYKMCPDIPKLSQITGKNCPSNIKQLSKMSPLLPLSNPGLLFSAATGFSSLGPGIHPPKELQADVVVHFGMPLGLPCGIWPWLSQGKRDGRLKIRVKTLQ